MISQSVFGQSVSPHQSIVPWYICEYTIVVVFCIYVLYILTHLADAVLDEDEVGSLPPCQLSLLVSR